MKKINKIIVSIFGGIDITFYVLTPMLLAVLFVKMAGVTFLSWLIFFLGAFASLFRGIKVGWMK